MLNHLMQRAGIPPLCAYSAVLQCGKSLQTDRITGNNVLADSCLSEYRSFKKKGATDEKASWAIAAAHLWCSRLHNFDPYCAWPQLGKYDWASFITEQRYQWSKWVWDASAGAPSLPSPWKWTPDYWTGKLMYSLHQPLDGKLPPADVATARPTHTVTVSCGATFTVWGTSCIVSRRCLCALLLSQDKFNSTWFMRHLKPTWTDSVWVMQIRYQRTVEAEPNPTSNVYYELLWTRKALLAMLKADSLTFLSQLQTNGDEWGMMDLKVPRDSYLFL